METLEIDFGNTRFDRGIQDSCRIQRDEEEQKPIPHNDGSRRCSEQNRLADAQGTSGTVDGTKRKVEYTAQAARFATLGTLSTHGVSSPPSRASSLSFAARRATQKTRGRKA